MNPTPIAVGFACPACGYSGTCDVTHMERDPLRVVMRCTRCEHIWEWVPYPE